MVRDAHRVALIIFDFVKAGSIILYFFYYKSSVTP